MYHTMKVAAVIPALNEERLISRTLDSVPATIDNIYVIDYGSSDKQPRLGDVECAGILHRHRGRLKVCGF